MADNPDSPTPVFTIGRLALWLVLALILVVAASRRIGVRSMGPLLKKGTGATNMGRAVGGRKEVAIG